VYTRVQIFRHGERTPIYKLGHNNRFTDAELKHLTERGKEGSRNLGSFLKCRYADFLSSHGPVNASSSDTPRTRGTLKIVLDEMGLTEPIHVLPKDTDNRLYREVPCPAYDKAYAEYKRTTLLPSETLRNVLLKEISRNASNYEVIYEVYDTLAIEHCQFDMSLPSWFSQAEFQPSQHQFFVGYVGGNPKMGRLYNGPLLHDIMLNLRQGRVNFFAGHDNDISTMMEVLGVYDISAPPPYNALLIFELHHHEEGQNKKDEGEEVRLLYHGHSKDLIVLPLPRCPSPCSLSNFISTFSSLSVDDETWRRECDEK